MIDRSAIDQLSFLFSEESSVVMLTCSTEATKAITELINSFGDLTALDIGSVLYRSERKADDTDFEIWSNGAELLGDTYLAEELSASYSGILESQLAAEVVTV